MNDSPSPSPSNLVYGLEEKVPFGAALLVSFQQVAAMVVGTITPPLILANVLQFAPAQTAYFVSMSLLASALGTFLQTTRFGPVGSGLLSVTGTSFSFLQPLIAAGQLGGPPLMVGMSLATAPLQIVLAPFLPSLRKVFTPLVSGIVVLLIGVSLIPTAMMSVATPLSPTAPAWAGAALAACVIAIVLVAQLAGKPWLKLASVLPAIAFGYLVCAIGGWLTAPAPGAEIFSLPRFAPFKSFQIDSALLIPFAFVYFFSLLEAMGDMTATSELSGLNTNDNAHWKRLRGGVLADGITSFVSALFGALPSTTYAQNNGVIQITGVASRRIGPLMAAMLAALGLFPVVGRWITVMPPPVLGALALMLFGLVAVSGLRLIARDGIGHREALIVALALAVGLGAPSRTEWLATLPSFLRTCLESGITGGGLTALLLNAALPRAKTSS